MSPAAVEPPQPIELLELWHVGQRGELVAEGELQRPELLEPVRAAVSRARVLHDAKIC